MNDQIVLHLQREFERRRKKNPRYSLRSLAQSMGVSASVLSRALNGETALGPKNRKIVEDFLRRSSAE